MYKNEFTQVCVVQQRPASLHGLAQMQMLRGAARIAVYVNSFSRTSGPSVHQMEAQLALAAVPRLTAARACTRGCFHNLLTCTLRKCSCVQCYLKDIVWLWQKDSGQRCWSNPEPQGFTGRGEVTVTPQQYCSLLLPYSHAAPASC